MKIEKIRLIESPKEEYSLTQSEMAVLVGGTDWMCPGTYNRGGILGDDYCEESYSTQKCGGSSNYCGTYEHCWISYDY